METQMVNRMPEAPRITSNRQKLKETLKKFTKQELLCRVGKTVWFRTSFRLNLKNCQKGTLVEYFVRNIDEENLGTVNSNISMLYMTMHSKSKLWNVCKICNVTGILKHVRDPVIFQRQLTKYMNRGIFNCHVVCDVHEEALWAHLTFSSLVKGSGKQKESSIYLIYYPLLPYVIYADMKVPFRPVIHRALLQIFEGTEIEDIAFTTRNFRTLIQMIWQKDGSLFDQHISAPSFVTLVSWGKNGYHSTPPVIECHSRDDEHKEEYIRETFGEFMQPPLEVLNLATETNFYGFDKEAKHPMKCRIQFSGSSIIEGFRKLTETGIATAPLPEFIGNIGTLGQNKFHVTEKSGSSYFLDDIPDFFSRQT